MIKETPCCHPVKYGYKHITAFSNYYWVYFNTYAKIR